MEVRPGANPADVKNYDTDRLRHDFLIQNLFVADEIKTIYSQIDRIIVGAATPVNKELVLILTVHQHIRHTQQYLLIQLRTFYLRIKRNLDVLRVLTIEQSISISFQDRLKAAS